MNLFKDMLKEGESLFLDPIPLEYDYQPKLILFREGEQKRFANAIKPLIQHRSGRNLFIYGPPGVGKTAACKHVFRELEETTDDIILFYVNCWKHNTTYKVMIELCKQLEYKFIQNRNTNDLFEIIKDFVNKKSAVFVFDEVDKVEDTDFLYDILEEIHWKSIFLITNYKDKVYTLDERIFSRLTPELIPFKPYDDYQTKEILKQRAKYAFVDGVWDNQAFLQVSNKTLEIGDIRKGLFLMKEAGNIAEDKSSRKIRVEHVLEAINKAEFNIKDKKELDTELKHILELVRLNNNMKIGTLYKKYNGTMSYKTFSRKIEKLKAGKFLSTEKITGAEGNTTIVSYETEKKLTEF